jgi:hypothetical protein
MAYEDFLRRLDALPRINIHSASTKSAYLVLVGGLSLRQAAKQSALSQHAVWAATRRIAHVS